jgi:Xaa-Pro aminopeptidase
MPYAPSDALSRRHAAVRAAMATASLDALVVVSIPNIAYLTNFGGSSACVVLTPDALHFITDSRYTTVVADTQQTDHACPGLDLVVVDGSYDATLASALSTGAAQRIGFEGAHLTVSRHAWLHSSLASLSAPPTLVPVENIVEQARCVKDAYEIHVLRIAGQMLSEVTVRVLGLVKRGMTERELALDIDTAVRRAGFEKVAFETIVASGPNAALPHARPTSRSLGEGDLVVLDFGGVHDSYCVDLTRTVVVGKPSERVHEVYDAVLRAHDRAVAASVPGASRFDIDAAARDVLNTAGMGAAFGHGTGHGLGLEVHEGPRIAKRGPNADVSAEEVTAGMVFTIEPGAYFPGWGGVRIEDDVLVTESGVELLTNAPTELIAV